MIPVPGEIYIIAYNKQHDKVITGSRMSECVHKDHNLMTKALEFRDAARRDGRLFICDLVPRWKRLFLKMLGIKYEISILHN